MELHENLTKISTVCFRSGDLDGMAGGPYSPRLCLLAPPSRNLLAFLGPELMFDDYLTNNLRAL